MQTVLPANRPRGPVSAEENPLRRDEAGVHSPESRRYRGTDRSHHTPGRARRRSCRSRATGLATTKALAPSSTRRPRQLRPVAGQRPVRPAAAVPTEAARCPLRASRLGLAQVQHRSDRKVPHRFAVQSRGMGHGAGRTRRCPLPASVRRCPSNSAPGIRAACPPLSSSSIS